MVNSANSAMASHSGELAMVAGRGDLRCAGKVWMLAGSAYAGQERDWRCQRS